MTDQELLQAIERIIEKKLTPMKKELQEKLDNIDDGIDQIIWGQRHS